MILQAKVDVIISSSHITNVQEIGGHRVCRAQGIGAWRGSSDCDINQILCQLNTSRQPGCSCYFSLSNIHDVHAKFSPLAIEAMSPGSTRAFG
jgi:hypothetical protein